MATMEEDVIIEQLAAIAKRGPSAGDVERLLQIACNSSSNRVVSVAIHCISKLGREATSIVPELANLLAKNNNTLLGCKIARALAAIGTTATSAIPELKAATKSSNKWVRQEARKSLFQICPGWRDDLDCDKLPRSDQVI